MHCLEVGAYFNSATINATWFCPASEELKQNKDKVNMKTNQKREEFHLDGDSIKSHVLTTFGRH